MAWGEGLIEARILTTIPFPARWEVEYWPDKDELERARGLVRFPPGMYDKSGWVPCDEEGRVLIDSRTLYNDNDKEATRLMETQLEPGTVVHVDKGASSLKEGHKERLIGESGCAGQIDYLGRVVFILDNAKHRLSQDKVRVEKVRTGDLIWVQQGEQSMKGRIVTICRNWPHYLVQISQIGGRQVQVAAHFQPQLGSRSGWQVCEDTSLLMGTWKIDEKSEAYKSAKMMCPTS